MDLEVNNPTDNHISIVIFLGMFVCTGKCFKNIFKKIVALLQYFMFFLNESQIIFDSFSSHGNSK